MENAELPIAASARKHGIADEDMVHALDHSSDFDVRDEGFLMWYGPARDGSPIEVGVSTRTGRPRIVHAMRDLNPRPR